MDGNQILQMHTKDWEVESRTFCETLTIATVVSRGCDQLHQSIKHLIKRRREHRLGLKAWWSCNMRKGDLVHGYKIFLLMFGCLITEHLTWVLMFLCNLAESMKMALNPSTQKWTLRILSVIARVGVLQLFVFLASIGGVLQSSFLAVLTLRVSLPMSACVSLSLAMELLLSPPTTAISVLKFCSCSSLYTHKSTMCIIHFKILKHFFFRSSMWSETFGPRCKQITCLKI